jgi:hypothetical protein
MKKVFLIIILISLLIPFSNLSAADHSHRSKYAGQEKREIRSLSESDMDDLRNGRGWGLAKAAELNGVPGPVHLLEMKKEINLSKEQVRKIEELFNEMKQEAIPLGLRLIELERELNQMFADRTVTDKMLSELLKEIARVRMKLRYVHLSSHLKTPAVLSSDQMVLYNKLRGYSSEDPCKNIPEGHDPEVWKRHNNCP